jgi:hypothetical protein
MLAHCNCIICIQPNLVGTSLCNSFAKIPKGPNKIMFTAGARYIKDIKRRLFLKGAGVFVKRMIKWSNKLKKTPRPKTVNDNQKPHDSSVGAEMAIESPNDQMAIDNVKYKNSRLVRLFTLEIIPYIPKNKKTHYRRIVLPIV